MKSTQFDDIVEFNTTFGHAVRDTPTLDAPDIPMRLEHVFLEEVRELLDALEFYDKVSKFYKGSENIPENVKVDIYTEVLDAHGDILVTLFGLSQAMGMPILEAFDIIHESNMSKLGEDGLPIYYPKGHKKHGKVAKGPNYFDPKSRLRALIQEKLNAGTTEET